MIKTLEEFKEISNKYEMAAKKANVTNPEDQQIGIGYLIKCEDSPYSHWEFDDLEKAIEWFNHRGQHSIQCSIDMFMLICVAYSLTKPEKHQYLCVYYADEKIRN